MRIWEETALKKKKEAYLTSVEQVQLLPGVGGEQMTTFLYQLNMLVASISVAPPPPLKSAGGRRKRFTNTTGDAAANAEDNAYQLQMEASIAQKAVDDLKQLVDDYKRCVTMCMKKRGQVGRDDQACMYRFLRANTDNFLAGLSSALQHKRPLGLDPDNDVLMDELEEGGLEAA